MACISQRTTHLGFWASWYVANRGHLQPGCTHINPCENAQGKTSKDGVDSQEILVTHWSQSLHLFYYLSFAAVQSLLCYICSHSPESELLV